MSTNASEKNKNGERLYSPFWPIFIVFAVLTLVQLAEAKNSLDRRKQIKAVLVEFSPLLPKAATIEQTVEKVSRDVIALSDGKTNEAAKIISEFNIRLNAPPPPAGQ